MLGLGSCFAQREKMITGFCFATSNTNKKEGLCSKVFSFFHPGLWLCLSIGARTWVFFFSTDYSSNGINMYNYTPS